MGEVSSGFGSRTKGDMSEKKTICFLIFAVGKANGGHYRSLSIISKALEDKFNVFIINLGYTHSKVILDSAVKNYFVYFNGFNFISALRKSRGILKNKNVDIFHCFDYQSLFIGKLLSNRFKKPVLYTKCGGPSPKGFFPDFHYLTVFSKEDYDFFKKQTKYSNTRIWLIPNRVQHFDTNLLKIKELYKKYNLDKKNVFLRICRISQFYKKSMLQAIHLIKTLKEEGFNVMLLIVGNIQDSKVYDDLKNIAGKTNDILIETDDYFTLNAKEIIDISTFVIGTGRGFMEASSCGKIMLTPSKNSTYPILIDENNFEDAFNKNFSERIEFSQKTINVNLSKIVKLLNNPEEINVQSNISKLRFDNYFSIEKGIEKYVEIYKSIKFMKISNKDLFYHWSFVVKNNIGTWYRIITKQY